MARRETRQFACLIMTAMFIDINGQCETFNFKCADYSGYLYPTWDCDQPNNEYQVNYQLLRACKHDTDNLDLSTSTFFGETPWTSFTSIALYKIPRNILTNSTYWMSVKSRVWQGDRFFYGSHHEGINFTTSEELYVDDTKRTSDSLSLTWNPYLDQCVSNNYTEYEYQLFRSTEGYIASSNVTTGTDITISGLECDTDYRFRVTYKKDTATGPDSFTTAKTQFQTPPTPIVKLNSSSETSLSFIWDDYTPCNTRDDIQVSYEFELQRRATAYELLQSGSEVNTWISFNNLDADADYRLRVRVSTMSSTGSSRMSGWSSYATGFTTSDKLPLTTPTLSVGGITNLNARLYTNQIYVTWDYGAEEAEFLVAYQLIRAGKCNETDEEGIGKPPFDRRTITSWSRTRGTALYYIRHGLFAYSSYWISVQARELDINGQWIYGPYHKGIIAETSEALTIQLVRPTSNSALLSWNGYPNKCLSESVYDYRLQGHDNEIKEAGTIGIADGAIVFTGLECSTGYTMIIKHGENKERGLETQWNYVTFSTTIPDSPPSRIKMERKPKGPSNSVTFTWDAFQQCNTQGSILVEYHFELLSRKSNSVAKSGISYKNKVTLDELTRDEEYDFRIRAFYYLNRLDTRRVISDWS